MVKFDDGMSYSLWLDFSEMRCDASYYTRKGEAIL